MKKLFTMILIAAGTISFASAQNRNENYYKQDRYQTMQTRDNRYSDQRQSNDWAYNNNGRNDDRNRQTESDRINQQYDNRIKDYRNDHSINRYERNRRMWQPEQERQQQSKTFGKGMVVGGAVGLLLGAILSH